MENKNNLGLVTKKTTVEKLIYKLHEDEYIQFSLPTKLYYDFKQVEKEQMIAFAKQCLNKALDLDIRTAYSNIEQYYKETYESNT